MPPSSSASPLHGGHAGPANPDECVQVTSAGLDNRSKRTHNGVPAHHRRECADVSTWTLAYDAFRPEEEGLREVLTSTGNGYVCTRGAAEWEDVGEVHYPGTYTHGAFNRETSILGGRAVLNEDMVNLPNWLVLKLRIEDDEPFRLDNVDLLSYSHEYDVATATVRRVVRFRDRASRETTLVSRRFVSMADRHLAGIEWTLTPHNWSGRVEVITALDSRVTNSGVPRYRQLEGRHLAALLPRTFGPEVIALKAQTRQSQIVFGQAARTRVYDDAGNPMNAERTLFQMEDYIHQVVAFRAAENVPTRVEKMVALFTSRDHAISEPMWTAAKAAGRAKTFEQLWARHCRAWSELWERCDVAVTSDERVQLLLRLHIGHVLQVCSRHTTEIDAGVPARGLNGEAYRGHIFWDELFVLPFFNFRLPEISRGLLMYRCRRLDEARAAAEAAGLQGAMFPWQSGSDGSEETQVVHLNPLSGRWDADRSRNQRHVNVAIFYNIWQYYQATGDLEFLSRYGAEVMLEITRYWASVARFNPERRRYEIHGVMGPDEFHEKYHDSPEEGLHNNAYTNVMVAWLADVALTVLDLLPDRRRRRLWDGIGLTNDELQRWRDLSSRMFVPFHDDDVISQFEGYDALEEFAWGEYEDTYGNIQRLDRILRAEGDTPDRYKLAKQADTLMLFFLLSTDELRKVFDRLGYPFRPDTFEKNVRYYVARTTHGSTLSYVVHAHVLARLDPAESWRIFLTALESDVGDVQGGTTPEGIHMGVMAGTLDLVQRSFLGARVQGDTLRFAPTHVDRLAGLSLLMRFQETALRVRLSKDELTVERVDDSDRPIQIGLEDDVRPTLAGQRHVFTWPAD
jgi:trehalose/maltose hydrolase-like predicted phosphorylase